MNNDINNNNSSNNSVTTSGFSEMKRLDLFDFSSLKKRKMENLYKRRNGKLKKYLKNICEKSA